MSSQRIICPQCKNNTFKIFVNPNGNFIVECNSYMDCKYSLKEIRRLGKVVKK